MKMDLNYQNGFGNYFQTEAIEGTLPEGQNSPQRCAKGLYAEQINGSSFLAPSHENLKTWMYRIKPTVAHDAFQPYKKTNIVTAPDSGHDAPPDQIRWDPVPAPIEETHFIDSLKTIVTCGDAHSMTGCATHIYHCNASMDGKAFSNADGDMLIVPQAGEILVKTELGRMHVAPKEICMVPRGIKFQVQLLGKSAYGYVCENYGAHFVLPYRGPIGANGLANERDFETPVAYFEDDDNDMHIITKFQGAMWENVQKGSVFNTVAWHGNYVPYKYNLDLFNTINTVSYDHPDPSIFTVLTSPSARPGTSNIDFVIFPPRWMVAENTFRPPYYHRNVMSEYMGLITGVYDAKPSGGGFTPGGGSLHNCMTGHGPDAEAFKKASEAKLEPERYKDTLAFMFETSMVLKPTKYALNDGIRQKDYIKESWGGLKKHFR